MQGSKVKSNGSLKCESSIFMKRVFKFLAIHVLDCLSEQSSSSAHRQVFFFFCFPMLHCSVEMYDSLYKQPCEVMYHRL